jgi:hypothetical protein
MSVSKIRGSGSGVVKSHARMLSPRRPMHHPMVSALICRKTALSVESRWPISLIKLYAARPPEAPAEALDADPLGCALFAGAIAQAGLNRVPSSRPQLARLRQSCQPSARAYDPFFSWTGGFDESLWIGVPDGKTFVGPKV